MKGTGPGPYEPVDFGDIYDRLEALEKRISDLETKIFVFENTISNLPNLMNRTVEKMNK